MSSFVNSTIRASERTARPLAIFSLYLFFLSMGPSTAGVNIASGVLLLATVLAMRPFWQDVRVLPVVWLMLGFLGYLTVQSLVFVHYFPALDESGNPHWTHLARTVALVSLPLAWWLTRLPHHLPWLLGAAAVSLAAGIVYSIDVAGIAAEGLWERRYWGSTQGEVSYMAAVGLIGCWILGIRLYMRQPFRSRQVLLYAPLLGLAGFVFLVALYGSQTRSTWGAVLITLAVFLGLELYRAIRNRRALVRAGAVLLSLVVAIAAVVAIDGGQAYERRLGGQSETLAAVLNLDVDRVMETNRPLGLRIRMWEAGVQAFVERPLVGWGVGSMRIIREGGGRDLRTRAHFHNAYLELLVGVGLVGFFAMAVIILLACRGALAAGLRDPALLPVMHITFAVLLMSSLTLFFEIRIGHTSGRSIMTLLLALLVMAQLRGRYGGSAPTGETRPPVPGRQGKR